MTWPVYKVGRRLTSEDVDEKNVVEEESLSNIANGQFKHDYICSG